MYRSALNASQVKRNVISSVAIYVVALLVGMGLGICADGSPTVVSASSYSGLVTRSGTSVVGGLASPSIESAHSGKGRRRLRVDDSGKRWYMAAIFLSASVCIHVGGLGLLLRHQSGSNLRLAGCGIILFSLLFCFFGAIGLGRAIRARSADLRLVDDRLVIHILEFGRTRDTISPGIARDPCILLDTGGGYYSVCCAWREGSEVKGMWLAHMEDYDKAMDFAKKLGEGLNLPFRRLDGEPGPMALSSH